jgi:hypothetical protein
VAGLILRGVSVRAPGARSQIVLLMAWLAGLAAFATYLHVRDDRFEERTRATSLELRRLRGDLVRLADTPAPSCGPPIVQAQIDVDALASRTADAVRQASPSIAQPTAASEPREDTPEQADALARAQSVLDGAIARGTIRREDMAEIRKDLAAGRPDEANELRKRIAVAINTSRVKVEGRTGPP